MDQVEIAGILQRASNRERELERENKQLRAALFPDLSSHCWEYSGHVWVGLPLRRHCLHCGERKARRFL